jgi:xanthine/CO dehydrogenase XdhC/CoxF family maturation factor
MSELLQVAAALSRAALDGQVSVLATVVRTEGSTYRRIGARLLILPDGSHVGAVSAGCIETDVLLRADALRTAGTAELITYDTRSSDDLVWGFGAGCGGMTQLLLEPLKPQQALSKAEWFLTIAEARRPSILATVVGATGVALQPGEQALLPHAAGGLKGFDAIPTALRAMVEATARLTLRTRSSSAVHHLWSGRELDLSYEVRLPRVRLSVCGAGPGAAPLVTMAKLLGWQVTLIDHRPAMLSAELWPGVDCITLSSTADIGAALERASPDAAVVMNHHYERDLESLAACLDSAVPFIGVLGPRHRTGLMLDRLHARGVALQGAEQRIHAPVGLDLGGETAEEIALSIVAEIKASVAGRTGGALRNREAPIHHGEQRRLEAV